jgi:hypothetical protein
MAHVITFAHAVWISSFSQPAQNRGHHCIPGHSQVWQDEAALKACRRSDERLGNQMSLDEDISLTGNSLWGIVAGMDFMQDVERKSELDSVSQITRPFPFSVGEPNDDSDARKGKVQCLGALARDPSAFTRPPQPRGTREQRDFRGECRSRF